MKSINFHPLVGLGSLEHLQRPRAKRPISTAERLGYVKGDRIDLPGMNFIRVIRGVPAMSADGKRVHVVPWENALQNMTTDLPFKTHKDYKHYAGTEYMIIDPQAYEGRRFLSTEPMDTFLFNEGDGINPKFVTIISGDKAILKEAKAKGMNVIEDKELIKIYGEGPDYDGKKSKSLLDKKGMAGWDKAKEYLNRVLQIIDEQFGHPSYETYLKFKKKTGIDPHVSKTDTGVEYDLFPTTEADLMATLEAPQHPRFFDLNLDINPELMNTLPKLLGSKPLRRDVGGIVNYLDYIR